MFLRRGQGAFASGTGIVDLRDVDASREAVAVSRVELREGDVVGAVKHHCKDVLLAHPHRDLQLLAGPGVRAGEHPGGEYLGGVLPRIRVEVAQQALKVGGGGSRREGCATPVMKHGSGSERSLNLLDDQIGWVNWCSRGEERGGIAMTTGELGFNGGDVGLEGGDGCWWWLGWKSESGRDEGERGGEDDARVHGSEFRRAGRGKQWRKAHASEIVSHGATI